MIPYASIVAVILLLICASATYNAVLLRGGKLAASQILIVLAMISLILSLLSKRFLADEPILGQASLGDMLFILGFMLLLYASVKLRSALK